MFLKSEIFDITVKITPLSAALTLDLHEPQPWTKLVETKVENPVNERNDPIFHIPNSPP